MKSLFLSIKQNDFVKGLIVAAISAALGVIQPAIAAGTVLSMTVLRGAGQAAAMGGIAYLTKNFFTNSQGKFATPEPTSPTPPAAPAAPAEAPKS